MSFGQKLKSIRKERKISQTELAQASGVAQRTISSYETDLSIPRTSNQLRKIADVLGVTPADLVSDDDRFLISSEEVEYKV
jgi:transcriptional regulator with XRE-family HTH domain